VLVILVIFSVWCWTVMFEKLINMMAANSAATRLEDTLESGTLEDMINYTDKHPVAKIIAAGNAEWREGSGEHEHEALHEVRDRVERAMRLELSNETRRLNKRLPFLATVGSSAPFIGLFGTVWGIMNAFRGLSNVQQATLSAVAPGIAEALVATAIGLFAAIPAVIAYNRYATELDRLANRFESFMEEFSNILQRQTR